MDGATGMVNNSEKSLLLTFKKKLPKHALRQEIEFKLLHMLTSI